MKQPSTATIGNSATVLEPWSDSHCDATEYSGNTIMWCHWIGSTVQLRPELRFERAWDRKAYDDGRRQNQLTVASDLIFHF